MARARSLQSVLDLMTSSGLDTGMKTSTFIFFQLKSSMLAQPDRPIAPASTAPARPRRDARRRTRNVGNQGIPLPPEARTLRLVGREGAAYTIVVSRWQEEIAMAQSSRPEF